ncbi:hypothetical protein L6R52_31500 [Myxococcota bacterium]|nr:hypothetical protein [Myxococcota bacterium]
MARALATFSRTARARQLYRSNNTMLKRMMADLTAAFTTLLDELGEISLKVRPDSIIFDDEIVLEEPNPDESIPFAFYRDGLRRLDLSQGIEEKELEVLVGATADGFSHSGLGDDVVSYLWRHELEHVRYMVVDTTIVDAAPGEAASPSTEAYDLDAQIDGLLSSIYGRGSQDDVGPRTVRVDASDISAKQIAETLDGVDEMAPGFHPARVLIDPPPYAKELLAELELEDENAIARRAAEAGLDALGSGLVVEEAEVIGESLLRLYDSSLVSGGYAVAATIVRGMRELALLDVSRERADAWLSEAVQEARLRQVIAVLQAAESEELARPIFELFESLGPPGVPAILALLPGVQDPTRRGRLGEIAARIGIDDLSPVASLLANEQSYVALEAVQILTRLGTPASEDLLSSALDHPQAPVRLALLQTIDRLPKARQLVMAMQLLDDPELEVKIKAAQILGTIRDIQAIRAIEARVKDPSLLAAPFALKQAYLGAYVALSQVKGLPLLAKFFQDGGGILAKKDAEELAIAAAHALGTLATPGAVAALKKAATFLNMRVRDAASEALRRTRVKP